VPTNFYSHNYDSQTHFIAKHINMLTDSSRDTREPLDRGWGMMLKGSLVAVSKLFIYILIGGVDSRVNDYLE